VAQKSVPYYLKRYVTSSQGIAELSQVSSNVLSSFWLKHRRDSTRVIYEILSLVKSGASKTQIVYRVNLNFQLTEKYISFLTAKGLVLKHDGERGLARYEMTARGDRFLQFLTEVEKELVELFPPAHAQVYSSLSASLIKWSVLHTEGKSTSSAGHAPKRSP